MICLDGKCKTEVDLWAGNKSVDVTDLDIQDSSHPNVAPFTGTLLLLDQPSTQPPHGSDGHLIEVPARTAEKRLDTLPGMGINYQDDLTGHNPAKKIGVITRAWIEGKKVRVQGTIWKKDFPEALRTFRMNRGRLGMSMELGDVYIRDKDEDVWHLEDFHFTGATILRKDHAAYEGTELAASKCFVEALAASRSASEIIKGKGGKPEMAEKDKEKKKNQTSSSNLVNILAAAVEKGISGAFEKFSKEQKESNEQTQKFLENLSSSQEKLVQGVTEMAAGGVTETDDEEEEVLDLEAGNADATMAMAHKKDASNASDASESSDPTDATEVEANTDPTNYTSGEYGDDAEPGDLNKDTDANYNEQSKGAATSRIAKPGGKQISRGSLSSSRDKGGRPGVAKYMAAATAVRNLTVENKKLRDQNNRFQNRLASMEASLERYAEKVERKTVSPELFSLMAKEGHDVRELLASKTKLTTAQVDDMFLKSNIPLDPTMRAALKNQMAQAGLLEDGIVRRWN